VELQVLVFMLEQFAQIILFQSHIPPMRIQLETLSSSEDFNHESKIPSMSTPWFTRINTRDKRHNLYNCH